VAEGTLPLFSRWHRSGNLLEPLEPGEFVGSHRLAGALRPGTRCVAELALRFVGRVV